MSAAIHFDEAVSPYRVTLEMIAAYLDKTPSRLSPALARLVEDGLLEIRRHARSAWTGCLGASVLPNGRGALRTLPEYRAFSTSEAAAAEVAKLYEPENTAFSS